MKQLLFIICLFTAFQLKAQDSKWLFGLNADSARILSDSIVGNIREGGYTFSKSGFYPHRDNQYFYFQYINPIKTGDDRQYEIVFFVRNDGENKALEMKGIPRYYLNSFYGKYLDIFPFWQKYVDPKADKIALSKQYNAYKTIHYLGHDKVISMNPGEDKITYSILIQ